MGGVHGVQVAFVSGDEEGGVAEEVEVGWELGGEELGDFAVVVEVGVERDVDTGGGVGVGWHCGMGGA